MPKCKHGSGSVYKRGKMWWITYYVDGKQVWESAKTKDRAEGRQLLQQRIGQRAEHRLVVGVDKVTFGTLIAGVENEYKVTGHKTLDKVRYRAKHLAKHFGSCRATDIPVVETRNYITTRQAEEASDAAINRELSVLRRGFNHALQADKITRMPHFPCLQESSPRARFFEPGEFEAVFGICPITPGQ